MKTTRLLVAAIAVSLLISAGCGGGNDVTEPLGTQLALVSDVAQPAAQEETTFTLTASNAQLNLKRISIDFDGDSNWDDERTIDTPAIKTTFAHTYPEAGTFRVRAEAVDANGVPTIATLDLTVGPVRFVPVFFFLVASSPQGGPCYAHGPPAECTGCEAPLGNIISQAPRQPLGVRARGSTIRVSQGFGQGPYATGQDVLYSCDYTMRLVAGTPPNDQNFGLARCSTTSAVNPVILTCVATITSTVP